MADRALPTPGRSIGKSLLLTLPILLWSLLMLSRTMMRAGCAPKLAAAATLAFMVALFFQMMRTLQTHRWRRYFFVTLGFLFPVGFNRQLFALRGSMSIPVERMLSGDTPFCFLAIPMMVPALSHRRDSDLPRSLHSAHRFQPARHRRHGCPLDGRRRWCWARAGAVYGCFFGGIEEGFAAIPPPSSRLSARIDPRWRWMPLGRAGGPLCCSRRHSRAGLIVCGCAPSKRSPSTPLVRCFFWKSPCQMGIFVIVLFGLVGGCFAAAHQEAHAMLVFSARSAPSSLILQQDSALFDIPPRPIAKAIPCVLCEKAFVRPCRLRPKPSATQGKPLLSCMKCGACVDACVRHAAVWHIKGTELARPRNGRA